MFGSVRFLAAAFATISVGGLAAEPVSKDQPAGPAWFALFSSQSGPARFISIGQDFEVLFVEATSANLEVASVVEVRRGPLAPEIIAEVGEALRVIKGMEPSAIASLRSVEAIEERGLFVDLAACANGAEASWFALSLEAMPPEIAETLRRVAAEAAKLSPRRPLSLVRVSKVDLARAKRIRADPRGFYAFIPISQSELGLSPHLNAALRCPGLVVETDEREDGLLRKWQRQSNPKLMGHTLFLEMDGSEVFQVHFQPFPKPN